MPRKALLKALRIALAGKLRDGEVLRWEGAPLPGEEPSTRTVRQGLQALGADDRALIVASGPVDRSLLLSVRNLPRVRILPAAEVTAYDIVRYRWVVLLDGAYEALRARLGLDGAGAEKGAAPATAGGEGIAS
jgi:ribosomal protein L4